MRIDSFVVTADNTRVSFRAHRITGKPDRIAIDVGRRGGRFVRYTPARTQEAAAKLVMEIDNGYELQLTGLDRMRLSGVVFMMMQENFKMPLLP